LGVPLAPTALTTKIEGDNIKIEWTVPTSDKAIISYEVKIKHNDGNWSTYSPNPETNTLSVAMLVLKEDPYNLVDSESVYAKVSAINSAGSSEFSAEGNGAVTFTPADAPTGPDAPTGLAASNPAATTADFSWTAPANNGGSAITGYNILKENSDSNFAAFGITVAGSATTV
jgi:hypothetical protein